MKIENVSQSPLVSVIMPAFNAEKYISEAIQSVINQSIKNWELLIVNDGSTDKTEEIVSSFNDPRIQYLKQNNKGVASARNAALKVIKGDYFCFLDSDDFLPPNSLQTRIYIFQQNPNLSFVDGLVIYKDGFLKERLKSFQPNFKGFPFKELIKINSNCYFGMSWMIKRESNVEYAFNEKMTHAEDLFFYISITKGKLYDYTLEEVLHYRISEKSAMADLNGLEDGYFHLYKNVKGDPHVTIWELVYLKLKIIKIMMLSHCFDGKRPGKSIKVFFKYLFA